MTKFKVGDRVRVVRNQSHTVQDRNRFVGMEFTIREYEQEWEGQPSWSMSPSNSYRWRESELELVAPSGPVRTVTRKEIVEGEYGMVLVDVHKDQVVVVVKPWHQPSPSELRAAADVFTQLADALEDQR